MKIKRVIFRFLGEFCFARPMPLIKPLSPLFAYVYRFLHPSAEDRPSSPIRSYQTAMTRAFNVQGNLHILLINSTRCATFVQPARSNEKWGGGAWKVYKIPIESVYPFIFKRERNLIVNKKKKEN